jgi:hypothetical protein
VVPEGCRYRVLSVGPDSRGPCPILWVRRRLRVGRWGGGCGQRIGYPWVRRERLRQSRPLVQTAPGARRARVERHSWASTCRGSAGRLARLRRQGERSAPGARRGIPSRPAPPTCEPPGALELVVCLQLRSGDHVAPIVSIIEHPDATLLSPSLNGPAGHFPVLRNGAGRVEPQAGIPAGIGGFCIRYRVQGCGGGDHEASSTASAILRRASMLARV